MPLNDVRARGRMQKHARARTTTHGDVGPRTSARVDVPAWTHAAAVARNNFYANYALRHTA